MIQNVAAAAVTFALTSYVLCIRNTLLSIGMPYRSASSAYIPKRMIDQMNNIRITCPGSHTNVYTHTDTKMCELQVQTVYPLYLGWFFIIIFHVIYSVQKRNIILYGSTNKDRDDTECFEIFDFMKYRNNINISSLSINLI